MIERAGQELRIEIDGPLPVHGDPTRLAQVFVNLLSNAARYAPSGSVVTVRGRAGREHATIMVLDEGPGIPPELLPELFEPFVQGERSLDRRQGGLGIGLSLVHSLVTAHGGDVAVESSPERGARFTIRLPTGHPSRRPAPRPPSGPAPDEQPLRIMVVDDNEDAAELMATLLRRRGHEVAVTYDGPSALELFERFHPDAALLDIGLPVMDGYELARRLRDDAKVLLVAVSGYGQSSDKARSREAGFHHHLVKPVRMADLAPVLEEARPGA